MWLVNGCLYVLWRFICHVYTFTGMQERKIQKRACVLKCSYTFHQFQMECFQLLGNILNSMQMYILMCTNNVRIRNICLFHVAVMEMSPPKGWACPRGPSAPWVIFWLLGYNEGAVARLLRGRVAALQPWPPPNPGKPILDWLPPQSQL